MLKNLVSTATMDRDDWLKWRQKGIGGSDASIICGINKYKSPIELWLEKTGQDEPKEAGEPAYWGNIMEPIIREEFTRRTGINVREYKYILQHSEYSFMFANIDGLIMADDGSQLIFEAKTASSYNSHEWELDVPESYQLQVQHYLAVTGFKGAYIAVLIGGNHFKYFYIERDEEIIKPLIKLEQIFWGYVENNVPPKIDGSQACSEFINRMYTAGTKKDVLELPEEALDLIHQYEISQNIEKDAATQKEEAVNKLKNLLGEHLLATVGGRIVSWSNVSTERLDTKMLKAEQPDIYAKYLSKSNYRRFSVR